MKGNKIVATIVVLVMLFSTMVVLNKLDVDLNTHVIDWEDLVVLTS